MINNIKANTIDVHLYIGNPSYDIIWIRKDDIEIFVDKYVDMSIEQNRKYYRQIIRDLDNHKSLRIDGVRLRFTEAFSTERLASFRQFWSPEIGHRENSIVSSSNYTKLTLEVGSLESNMNINVPTKQYTK